jgi:hypothetical protein
MLVEISNKFDRAQKGVGVIREALDDDRTQSLRAAIEGVRNALEARNPKNKHALMTATIPELQKPIDQTIRCHGLHTRAKGRAFRPRQTNAH